MKCCPSSFMQTHTSTYVLPHNGRKKGILLSKLLSYLVVVINLSSSSTGDLLWGCTQFISPLSVAHGTPCLGCNLLSRHYRYSKLWTSALLFPDMAVLWLVISSALLMRPHFVALFSHNHKLTSVHVFLCHQKKKSLSSRYMPLTTFYSPTPLCIQQRSSSLTIPVLTLPCLDFISRVLKSRYSFRSGHDSSHNQSRVRVVTPSAKDAWKLQRKLLYPNEAENEEPELCIYHYRAAILFACFYRRSQK